MATSLLPPYFQGSAVLQQVMAVDKLPGGKGAELNDAQKRIQALSQALSKMQSTSSEASRCCDQLSKRSRHLDSLTSPANDASAMLSQAASNLGSTLLKLKDARDKFETVRDCEPAIERLNSGVEAMSKGKDAKKPVLNRQGRNFRSNPFDDESAFGGLSEQDVYAAADSMEILRDAFDYFLVRKNWRSTPSALQGLERVHKVGVSSMCTLITLHLVQAGPSVRLKREGKDGGHVSPGKNETAEETRERLTRALQNRDLLKSIGEYEEHQPVEARPIREMRSIFECLGGEGYHLGPTRTREPASLTAAFGIAANKVVRTEKVGSGGYTNLVKKNLRTGFPHIDAYGESRKDIAFKCIDGYYKKIKSDRKKASDPRKTFDGEEEDDADVAARDAVKCLEHAMVVVAGEKNVYRACVAPSLLQGTDEDATQISPFYRKACIAAYSHIVAAIVDRAMDIIETVFLKEGLIGQSSGDKGDKEGASSPLTVRNAASAAASGLRMLDGVRMLGPSLAKLCDMPYEDDFSADVQKGGQSTMTVASTLCIAIHRTTVKNTAKTLENLAKAIQEDPVNGVKHRPPDARIASVSSDVVRALRLISPFVSAYKSVTKRRALPWDPNIGEEAGEMESYVRFLIMRLLNSLQGKALNYTKGNEEDEGGQAKANMFIINNTFYLLQQLAPKQDEAIAKKKGDVDSERYQLDRLWFEDKVKAIFASEKVKYLTHWELINVHLTSVDSSGLEYQKNKNLLSLESGRLFKDRFKGFNDDFEQLYRIHNALAVIDPELRRELQADVKKVFLNRYEKFYDKYSRFRFSKKNQNEYLKFPPEKVDSLLDTMFGGQGFIDDE